MPLKPKKIKLQAKPKKVLPKKVLGLFLDKENNIIYFGMEGNNYFVKTRNETKSFGNINEAYEYLSGIKRNFEFK